MIEYDKDRLTDLDYIKKLLEGKYIKTKKGNKYTLFYIQKVKDLSYWTLDEYFFNAILDCYGVVRDETGDGISVLLDWKIKLDKTFEDYSFTTKEEFMNACNKVMEEITKGVENE
jgi:hypothetical protein